MKFHCLLITCTLLATSCSVMDHESDFIDSPKASYSIKSKVNRSDSGRKDYALVTLFLFDKNHKQLDSLNTHAGDAMAWATGWADTTSIVLYSSDIGTQAWKVSGGKFHPTIVTVTVSKQADILYKNKYK